MNDANWHEFAEAESARDRTALSYLRDELPGYEPVSAWVNFRFLPLEGGFFDCDALICSRRGFFLVELAPYGGYLNLQRETWEQLKQNEEVEVFENPVLKAQQKATALRELLEVELPSSFNAPPIDPLVFLSHPDVEVDADSDALDNIAFHEDIGRAPTVFDAIIEAEGPGISGLRSKADVTPVMRDRVGQALERSGIEGSRKHIKIRDWRLGDLLDSGPRYQDFEAKHASRDEVRRARVFRLPKGASDDQLERIQEAARREFELLQELDHDGILKAREHIGHETRPTILFDTPEGAERLDHVVESGRSELSSRKRLDLIESIGESLAYAHGHNVIHRALGPHSVLVMADDQGGPPARLFNWHTARQEEGETGTSHVENYLNKTSQFFLAPELNQTPEVDETADIFGLGALTYFLFTGEPPARAPQQFISKLADKGGLRISAVDDTVPNELDDLVYEATRVAPSSRVPTVDEFLKGLESARKAVLGANPTSPEDPLEAQPDDQLAGRWKVIRRLGSGSTSTAFLAEDSDGSQVVLKIANDESHENRLKSEAEALARFDDPQIVDLLETTSIGGRKTLVLQYAGESLRQELRDRSALSLDEQRRFGEDIGHILRALESEGVFHKDFKPANLGHGQVETNRGPNRLLLFDFSLHDVDLDRVEVGTRAYRDPFLQERDRWDAAADRYSAAMVLYEMVTQRLPTWGDGRSNPAFDAQAELHLDAERFPASVRDDLTDFFRSALARDVEDRFDTADDMLEAWKEVFRQTVHTEDDELTLSEATPETPLSSLGVSEAARDILDDLGVTNVRELLSNHSNVYQFKEGAGGQVRSEILRLRDQLASIFPSLDVSQHSEEEDKPDSVDDYSVDDILDNVQNEPKDFEYKVSYGELIAEVLQMDDADRALPWARTMTIASELGLNTVEINELLNVLRQGWQRKRSLKSLRDDLVRIIDKSGGAMVDRDLAAAVLWEKGSLKDDQNSRMARASAITRAAVEAELAAEEPRLSLLRVGGHAGGPPAVFVGTDSDLMELLPELGDCADEVASQTPLASSARAYTSLLECLKKGGVDALPKHELLTLAAAASEEAALSHREELYPVGMDPVRAIKLTGNLLRRRSPLKTNEIHDIVSEHYPQAGQLPESATELEDLIQQADVGLEYDPSQDEGRGAFIPKTSADGSSPAMTRTSAVSSGTYHSRLTPADRDDRCREFTHQASIRARQDDFFVVTVSKTYARRAEEWLAAEYDLEVCSVDDVVLDILRERTNKQSIDWSFFLSVDAPDADDGDRNTLGIFLRQQVIEALEERLMDQGERVLYTNLGLLGRWNELANTMKIVERLRSRTRDEGPELAWLLIPSDRQQKLPTIADVAVPVDRGDFKRFPRDLVERPESVANLQD